MLARSGCIACTTIPRAYTTTCLSVWLLSSFGDPKKGLLKANDQLLGILADADAAAAAPAQVHGT